ncbi:MAG: hypothetical protein OEW39_11420 [Deltaproteobacteria bacterium]|nr:hypothetical protein [Deltaproteobacteria bacterium]
MKTKISSYHVGIAAEAIAAAQFARIECDISVQYGANQPEYDLVAVRGKQFLKISVKGSQDGSWGLTQNLLSNANYHKAADDWLNKHQKGTVYCFVQFKDAGLDQLPRIYLALPSEIAIRLKETSKGRGDTILYEHHTWGPTANAAGTIEKTPDLWKFSKERVDQLFEMS